MGSIARRPLKRRTQRFLTSGTWTRPVGVDEVDILAVAGGGPGGMCWFPSASTNGLAAGGGGGGEVVRAEGVAVTGDLTIVIGAGGTPVAPSNAQPGYGGFGGDTIVGPIRALGGGPGGNANNTVGRQLTAIGHPRASIGGDGATGIAYGGGGAGAGGPGKNAGPVAIPYTYGGGQAAGATGSQVAVLPMTTPVAGSSTNLPLLLPDVRPGGKGSNTVVEQAGDGGLGRYGFGGGGAGGAASGSSTATNGTINAYDGGGAAVYAATGQTQNGNAGAANTGGGGSGSAKSQTGAAGGATGGAGGSGTVIISWWE